MATCPPLAVDRLVGLAGVDTNLVGRVKKDWLPTRLSGRALPTEQGKIADIVEPMTVPDPPPWLDRVAPATPAAAQRAAAIVADRLCAAHGIGV